MLSHNRLLLLDRSAELTAEASTSTSTKENHFKITVDNIFTIDSKVAFACSVWLFKSGAKRTSRSEIRVLSRNLVD